MNARTALQKRRERERERERAGNLKLTGRCTIHTLVDDFCEFRDDDTRPGAKLKNRQRFRNVLHI